MRMPGGMLRADLVVEARLDFLDGLDGVGVGDLDDAEADGDLAVEARHLAVVGQAVLDLGHVAKAHRRLFAKGHDQLAELIDLMEFEVELDQAFGRPANHKAAGELHVLFGKGVGDVLGGDLVGRHAVGPQIDPDGAVATSAETYFADAVDPCSCRWGRRAA